jgi:hypothetical protein
MNREDSKIKILNSNHNESPPLLKCQLKPNWFLLSPVVLRQRARGEEGGFADAGLMEEGGEVKG